MNLKTIACMALDEAFDNYEDESAFMEDPVVFSNVKSRAKNKKRKGFKARVGRLFQDVKDAMDGMRTMTFKITIDTPQYGRSLGLDIPDDSPDARLTGEEDGDDATKSAGASSVDANDEIVDCATAEDDISYDDNARSFDVGGARQRCATPATKCRAQNPLTCRFHGLQVFQNDIARAVGEAFRAAGKQFNGNVNVEMQGLNGDDAEHSGTVSLYCEVTVPDEDAELVSQAMRTFGGMPGVTVINDDGESDSNIDIDFDRLDPNAKAKYRMDELPEEERGAEVAQSNEESEASSERSQEHAAIEPTSARQQENEEVHSEGERDFNSEIAALQSQLDDVGQKIATDDQNLQFLNGMVQNAPNDAMRQMAQGMVDQATAAKTEHEQERQRLDGQMATLRQEKSDAEESARQAEEQRRREEAERAERERLTQEPDVLADVVQSFGAQTPEHNAQMQRLAELLRSGALNEMLGIGGGRQTDGQRTETIAEEVRNDNHESSTNEGFATGEDAARRLTDALSFVTREANAEAPTRNQNESDLDYSNRVIHYNYTQPDAERILPEVNSIINAVRNGERKESVGQQIADMVAHNYNWENRYGEVVAETMSRMLTGEDGRVSVESATHRANDGHVEFGDANGIMNITIPGFGTIPGHVTGRGLSSNTSATAGHVDTTVSRHQCNGGTSTEEEREEEPQPIGFSNGRQIYPEGSSGQYVRNGAGGWSELRVNPFTGEVMREEDLDDDEYSALHEASMTPTDTISREEFERSRRRDDQRAESAAEVGHAPRVTDNMRDAVRQITDDMFMATNIRETPESLADMFFGGSADESISLVRNGFNNAGGHLDANPELADYLQSIRTQPRSAQVSAMRDLMGVTGDSETTSERHQGGGSEANHSDITRAAEILSDDLGELGSIESLTQSYDNDRDNFYRTVGRTISNNGMSALERELGADNDLVRGIRSAMPHGVGANNSASMAVPSTPVEHAAATVQSREAEVERPAAPVASAYTAAGDGNSAKATAQVTDEMRNPLVAEFERAAAEKSRLFAALRERGVDANDRADGDAMKARRYSSYLGSLSHLIGRNGSRLEGKNAGQILEDAQNWVRDAHGADRTLSDGTVQRGRETTKYKRAKDAARFIGSKLGANVSFDDETGNMSVEWTDRPEAVSVNFDYIQGVNPSGGNGGTGGATSVQAPQHAAAEGSSANETARGETRPQNTATAAAPAFEARNERAGRLNSALQNVRGERARNLLTRIRDRANNG